MQGFRCIHGNSQIFKVTLWKVVYIVNQKTCMHVVNKNFVYYHYRDGTAKTIREAIVAAKNDNLEWYLALNDSIIGTIKCADPRSVPSNLDKQSLKRVYITTVTFYMILMRIYTH